jgi:hypothetical protein
METLLFFFPSAWAFKRLRIWSRPLKDVSCERQHMLDDWLMRQSGDEELQTADDQDRAEERAGGRKPVGREGARRDRNFVFSAPSSRGIIAQKPTSSIRKEEQSI